MSNKPTFLKSPGTTGYKPQSFQVKVEDLEEIYCDNCEADSPAWVEAYILKYAGPLQSPTGQPHVVKIPCGFICGRCGSLNDFRKTENNKGLFPEVN